MATQTRKNKTFLYVLAVLFIAVLIFFWIQAEGQRREIFRQQEEEKAMDEKKDALASIEKQQRLEKEELLRIEQERVIAEENSKVRKDPEPLIAQARLYIEQGQLQSAQEVIARLDAAGVSHILSELYKAKVDEQLAEKSALLEKERKEKIRAAISSKKCMNWESHWLALRAVRFEEINSSVKKAAIRLESCRLESIEIVKSRIEGEDIKQRMKAPSELKDIFQADGRGVSIYTTGDNHSEIRFMHRDFGRDSVMKRYKDAGVLESLEKHGFETAIFLYRPGVQGMLSGHRFNLYPDLYRLSPSKAAIKQFESRGLHMPLVLPSK